MRTLFVVLALSCGVAHADGWQVTPSLLVGIEDFDYHEDVAPAASTHHGDQLTSRIEVMVVPPIHELYARAIAGFTNGKMPFVGTDQTGDPITPAADAAGHMTDLELEVGYHHRMRGGAVWLGGYAGLGRRTWDRDLRPIGSGGYREDYAWLTFPVGAEVDVVVAEGLVLEIEGTAMFTDKGTMRLHLSDYDPSFSDLDIALNNQPGGRARVRGTYAFDQHIRFLAEATYEYSWMTAGASTEVIQNGAPTSPAMYASEPETHTRRISLLLGIGYEF
jgi:hypothetical protein